MDRVQAFDAESQKIQSRYLHERKTFLKEKVDNFADYIEYKKAQTEKRIRADVRSRTHEAYTVAEHIYQTYKDTLSLVEIKNRVHDALFAASWDNGHGYYFAEDMQGTELINRNNPELEGTNIWDVQDVKGNHIMQDIIRVAQSPEKEGFTTYYWNKPDHPGKLVLKISYVKYFAPFDWVIGNGKYLDDETGHLQKEVLQRIESMRLDNNDYIFAATWDGISLTYPFAGQNMLNVEDRNGLKIVQELIKTARSGGGFVQYVMPSHEGIRPDPKLSYVKGIPEWQWYVGAGVYVGDIESVISERQIKFRSQLKGVIIRTSAILLILLLAAFLMAWLISRKLNRHFSIFNSFFQDAAVNSLKIDVTSLEYAEFRTLAEKANEMIDMRKQAMDALDKSEQRFISMVELAPIPMVISTDDGRLEYINKQFESMFGYAASDIPDVESWMKLAYPDSDYRDKILKLWNEAVSVTLEAGKSYETGIIKVSTARGEILDVKFFYTRVGDRGLTVAYNLTEILKSENERIALHKQLHQAQKMEALGLMAGGVAHDLNNILSGVVNYPEIMLMDLPEDSKLRRPLNNIHQAGLRAAEVVADLLTVSRGVRSEKKVIDMNVMVKEYLTSPEFHKLSKNSPGVHVTPTYDHGELFMACSRIHVKKTIMNLVVNAAEAIGGEGEVSIRTSLEHLDSCLIGSQSVEAGDYVVLTVSDTGPGIREEDLEHIFEPFYTKKVMGASGTGLGLSIVWNTMHDHMGAVTVTSDSKRTTFKLYFPASDGVEVPDQERDEDTVPIKGNGETVMVVDDEPLQIDVASQMLTALGYKVKTATSGEDAIEQLKAGSVDLIMLDMIMKPGISGYETYERIVAMYPGQKALIVSGYSQNVDVLRIQQLGSGKYIKKPYTFRELGKAVKQVLQSE